MCIVYQAWDTRLQRNVAVKRLEPPLNEDPRTRARFDREGRALAQLSHPNLVTLIDRGSSDNEDYLVFEYIEGRSLKDLIREGPLGVGEVGRIAGQVAEGLAAAHLAGIIHRDVKPQNILIDRHGYAKVTDFGIATGPDWTRVTRAGSVIGSARYMSPEQVKSKPVDARSDVYSLGVVMYEMLTGHPPFDGTNMPEIARMHLNTPPPPISEVRLNLPDGLEKVVLRCLAKDPEDRFASMDELLGALTGLGLYAPQRTAELSAPQKRTRRHGSGEERRARSSATGTAGASASGAGDEEGGDRWLREHARSLARKRKARRRWKILGALAAIIVVALVVVLLLTLPGGGAPSVVGLSYDKASKLAEEAGMEPQMADQIPTFDEPSGTVLVQDPIPGGSSEDDILRLTVSKEPTPVQVTEMKDYDPQGDDTEHHDQVPNLIDGKDSTSWTTELYRSAEFGTLPKTGVGLEFTLAEDATILVIISPVEGWQGELQQDLSSGSAAKLAALDGSARQVIPLQQSIKSGRIWFTKLAQLTADRWGVELSEIQFYK